jgi:hypothetical protein
VTDGGDPARDLHVGIDAHLVRSPAAASTKVWAALTELPSPRS